MEFCAELKLHMGTLNKYYTELNTITPYKISIKKAYEIGYIMKYYYAIYSDLNFHSAMTYSFGFNAFEDHLNGFKSKIQDGFVNKCRFSKKETKLTDAYFAPLIYNKPIKNTIALNNEIIITGPNAAGKTTLLKTAIFNIILSQQTGYGFYKKATICPYDMIHCYLNIPDTSGRDSLFQAESRRCKEILDLIAKNPKQKHFCIFDELYSGTNPYEAVASAYSFTDYLTKYENVNFVLTTHYIQLCKLLDSNKRINNCNMKIEHADNGDFIYTYKLQKGISNIKGGLKVLYNLDYPEPIIKKAEETLNIL